MQMPVPRPRRHFAITGPSAVVLLACVFLPSYHDCGRDHLMSEEPATVLVGPWGVIALVIAIAMMRRRGELVLACITLAISFIYAGVLTFGMLATRPLVGLSLAFTAMLALVASGFIWIAEVNWKTPPSRRIVFGIAAAFVVAYGLIGVFVPRSLPSDEPNYDRAFTVH